MDDNRFTVLFMGSWHGPNIDASLALLEVARRVPQVRVMLVGSVCEYLRRWHFSCPANVELAGVVDESQKNETLGWVDLAVNPTETGSGTNLKMLDYLAAGVPVLTTPFGGRGLELEDGVHARIAPMLEFPAEIERIRTTPDEALSRMVRNAREHVEARFTWRGIADRLANRIREAYFDSDSQSGER
jgi:glycosyltransferase involved in cell wall biosynthesis